MESEQKRKVNHASPRLHQNTYCGGRPEKKTTGGVNQKQLHKKKKGKKIKEKKGDNGLLFRPQEEQNGKPSCVFHYMFRQDNSNQSEFTHYRPQKNKRRGKERGGEGVIRCLYK